MNLELSNIETINETVEKDLMDYIKSEGISFRQALNKINKQTGLGVRTVEKILKKEIKSPSYQTIMKIYSVIYNTNIAAEILDKLPMNIRIYCESSESYFGSKASLDLKANVAEEDSITKDEIVSKMYVLSGGDFGINIETVKNDWGANGLKAMDKLNKFGYVTLNDDGYFVRGARKLQFSPQTSANFTKAILNERVKDDEEIDELSTIRFYSFDCTKEDLEWLNDHMSKALQVGLKKMDNTRPAREEAIRATMSLCINSVLRGDL